MSDLKNYWCPIDSGSKMYPLLVTANTKSVYRINIVLKETIDNIMLKQALNEVVERFPYYKVKIKSGFFWHYLERNENSLKVYPDDGYVLRKLSNNENDDYLFRVTYYKNRVSLEIFHALTDANGAFEFLKSIIRRYLILTGKQIGDNNLMMREPYCEEESEDAFLRYYKPCKMTIKQLKKMSGVTSTGIEGEKIKHVGYRVMSLHMSASELKNVAKSYSLTVTSYLVAAYVEAIGKLYGKKKTAGGIRVMVPINLRKAFPSKTMKNFVAFYRVTINNTEEIDFPTLANAVHSQLSEVNESWMAEQINIIAKGMRTPILRFMPMFIKYPVFRTIKCFSDRVRQTGIVSSLGVLKLPDGMTEHIESTSLCVNVSKLAAKNMGVVTVGDVLTCTITSAIKDTLLEKELVDRLLLDGIKVKVITNGIE